MTYYKIIRDGQAVDAGFTFLKWDERHKCLMGCEPSDAELVKGRADDAVYHIGWLNAVPAAAGAYETVEAAMIDETEYEDLCAALDDGETVPEPDPIETPEEAPAPEETTDDEPEEKPMTVGEMRRRIAEQEEMIAMLTECVLEMSEVVYG